MRKIYMLVLNDGTKYEIAKYRNGSRCENSIYCNRTQCFDCIGYKMNDLYDEMRKIYETYDKHNEVKSIYCDM